MAGNKIGLSLDGRYFAKNFLGKLPKNETDIEKTICDVITRSYYGSVILEVEGDFDAKEFSNKAYGLYEIGTTNEFCELAVLNADKTLMDSGIDEVINKWIKPLSEVFHTEPKIEIQEKTFERNNKFSYAVTMQPHEGPEITLISTDGRKFGKKFSLNLKANTAPPKPSVTLAQTKTIPKFQLDAAYLISTVQNNPLDQTLRFSLSFDNFFFAFKYDACKSR